MSVGKGEKSSYGEYDFYNLTIHMDGFEYDGRVFNKIDSFKRE